MNIGYSTGAICRSSLEEALEMMMLSYLNTVEISCLREKEFHTFIEYLDTLNLTGYEHISFHAPSKLSFLSEIDIVHDLLEYVVPREWGTVLHPDVIEDYSSWTRLGEYLRIENMDKRKNIGKTVEELEKVFEELPEATWCFDIGHAAHLDRSMKLANDLLSAFSSRLAEVHLSHVDSEGGHSPLDEDDYRDREIFELCRKIPYDTPIILEAHDFCEGIGREVGHVERYFFPFRELGDEQVLGQSREV